MRGQEPLAVEVRSQGSTAQCHGVPPTAVFMTPPVDVGKCLVVEGEAAEEYLGADSDIVGIGLITLVPRLVILLLKRLHEGVFAGGEDGLDDAGFGINGTNGTINIIYLILNITVVWIIGSIGGLELFAEICKFLTNIMAIIRRPFIEDPLEVLANFLSNISGPSLTLNGTAKRLKGCSNVNQKALNITPFNLIKIVRNTAGHLLQPRSSATILIVKLLESVVDAFEIALIPLIFQITMPLTPLQHPYSKRYGRVAQPMRRNVRRRDASAGDFTNVTRNKTGTIIPNELLKSLGQLANQFPIIKRFPNLCNLCTKVVINTFNFSKKLLNLFG
ncbi:hydroxymethylglutaryl-CoA lyase [Babesia caballi]|uniref:Hydroxymethylglutaryl-CoA lyase n=1 Tax=Babesia caballi TaxID=5871 RepID=A0AAV4LP80_BABCB|nr:hydroxymethylglutaryl-CoA lyase [Babesia caballi]